MLIFLNNLSQKNKNQNKQPCLLLMSAISLNCKFPPNCFWFFIRWIIGRELAFRITLGNQPYPKILLYTNIIFTMSSLLWDDAISGHMYRYMIYCVTYVAVLFCCMMKKCSITFDVIECIKLKILPFSRFLSILK